MNKAVDETIDEQEPDVEKVDELAVLETIVTCMETLEDEDARERVLKYQDSFKG